MEKDALLCNLVAPQSMEKISVFINREGAKNAENNTLISLRLCNQKQSFLLLTELHLFAQVLASNLHHIETCRKCINIQFNGGCTT